MSFTLGLAILGGAVATGLQNYIRSASAEQRRLSDRIALETAAATLLGQIAAGRPVPLKATSLPQAQVNGRSIAIEVSLPEGKRDLRGDQPEEIAAVFEALGINSSTKDFRNLEALSQLRGISPSQEDCLRRVATLGRAPEEYRPSIADGSLDETFTVSAGDQIDLRLSLVNPPARVLWIRARFTGQGSGWKLHDYRNLTLATETPCEP